MHFTPEESAAKTLLPGDLLVCEGGDIGRSAIWNGELPQCSFQNHLHRLRPKRYEVVPHFFMYYLQAGFTQLGIYEGAGNKTTIPNLSRSRLASLEVPLPPKPEQQKIAAVLWKLQRAIATQDRLLAATADLKQSAMQQLFTHGLHGEPLKQTEIGPMPKSWRLLSCEDSTRSITVGVVVKPASHYVDEGVPAFRSFNVREDLLDDRNLVYFSQSANDSVLSKSKLSTGDILVVRTGYPGTSCVVPAKYNEANCIDLVIVRPNPDVAVPEYVSRFFNSHVGRAQTTASSFGLAQQHLNVGAVKRTLLALPSLDEQRAIAAALDTIDKKLAHHRAKRVALHDLFETLLHKLMTAEIRVADLDTSDITDHFADVGKMIDRPGKASEADHVPDAGEMIRKPKGKHR